MKFCIPRESLAVLLLLRYLLADSPKVSEEGNWHPTPSAVFLYLGNSSHSHNWKARDLKSLSIQLREKSVATQWVVSPNWTETVEKYIQEISYLLFCIFIFSPRAEKHKAPRGRRSSEVWTPLPSPRVISYLLVRSAISDRPLISLFQDKTPWEGIASSRRGIDWASRAW